MSRVTLYFLISVFLVLGLGIFPFDSVVADGSEAMPQGQDQDTPTPSVPSPADIINAVNNLRMVNGLNVLSVDPVLMAVAAEQASALAASEGAVGHERPCGMSLGQQLLVMGYPLWGDLSMDGCLLYTSPS